MAPSMTRALCPQDMILSPGAHSTSSSGAEATQVWSPQAGTMALMSSGSVTAMCLWSWALWAVGARHPASRIFSSFSGSTGLSEYFLAL